MVVMRGMVGRQELPNLSLMSKVVLFMAFGHIVRVVFSCLSLLFHTSHTQLSCNMTPRNSASALGDVIVSVFTQFTRNPPFLPFLPMVIAGRLPTNRILLPHPITVSPSGPPRRLAFD